MIKFSCIKYKNFLSSGNHFTEIPLDKHSNTLIIGTNGSGKSTILDALTFSLFNKPFRKINKNQLINSTNEKDCVVEIEFSISNTDWIVRRGIKPAIFEIYRNGELLDQESSSKDQQTWLEQTVLKMNYKSFTQIVILGSASFVPFMQLTPQNRREVIEDLLDIGVFSNMNAIVKDKLKNEKDIVKELLLKKQTLEEKEQMQKNFIIQMEKLNEETISKNKDKINELIFESKTHSEQNNFSQTLVNQLILDQEKFINASDKINKLNTFKGQIKQKGAVLKEEYEFFNKNTVCPTCTQSIQEEFRLNKINDVQNKVTELKKGYEDLESTIKLEEERERQFNTLSKEITKLNYEISQNNTRINHIQRQIADLETEIQTITERIETGNTEHEKLNEFSTNLKITAEELSKRKEQIVYYDFAYSLLKDDGVKTKIIQKYLPFINQQINNYLQLMDFYINFNLDEEFNESIHSPLHEHFSYDSFSEGEKMRIDLSLLFTWREVARVKNSINTNLLVMDEVFDSSLDGFGTDEFLKIIRFTIKDANIFVISHKSELHDKFENVLKFHKHKGFSTIEL